MIQQPAVPARHASKPMEPAMDMHAPMGTDEMNHHQQRAYDEPRVVYVTETRECSCKGTPAPNADPMHISQIPVHVPSSSMGGMAAASSPASNRVMVGGTSSSVLFGSQVSSATPSPSNGPNRVGTFKGAAAKTDALRGGAAAVAVAAVMGLMVAL